LDIPNPQNPDSSALWSLRTSGQHPPVVVRQRKGQGDLNILP
jgi:hypothetical protein